MKIDQIKPQFITDENGKRISVILPMNNFRAIMEELEELEDIKQYDEAMKDKDPGLPIDEAFKIIEASRAEK